MRYNDLSTRNFHGSEFFIEKARAYARKFPELDELKEVVFPFYGPYTGACVYIIYDEALYAYIGSTKSLEHRWRAPYSHSSYSVNFRGCKAIILPMKNYSDDKRHRLYAIERKFIERFNVIDGRGYNKNRHKVQSMYVPHLRNKYRGLT